ncbi:hypothetical protein HAX54_017470 [Datura stramonium]|uniref:Uncharacterized protein n=1 Tax=Datura stramonium TaxID=4076 RepID=A0ABS8UMG4_DATST|nr:hypothetical protein [Datura stramonium]
MAAMRELLRGFPRPPTGDRLSSTAVVYPKGLQGAIASLDQVHAELQVDLRERKGSSTPRTSSSSVAREDIQQSSFLSRFEEKEADELSNGSDEASS